MSTQSTTSAHARSVAPIIACAPEGALRGAAHHSAPARLRARALGQFALVALALVAVFLGSACGPKYPKCKQDEDCKAGEFCVEELCQKCRTDADCKTGQSCNAGACEDIAGYCDERIKCPGGQECVGNRCQAPQSEPLVQAPKDTGGCQLQAVYFGYDSSNLESSARDVIAKNAQCVREKAMSSVRVTGYTDNRGTEEYNLALGDRRARSVEQYMSSLGVDKNKLTPASMGEELSRGDDESSMAQDRRVEFTSK
ncbi:MAG: peptidoglycan-associated outer rane lipoprotein [Myxococcaceae bacterium]|nr:peptidoglycan-associated outer rane lipoprotein [Myxococcaceae bacterium]